MVAFGSSNTARQAQGSGNRAEIALDPEGAMDTDNREATTTSDLMFLTDRTCFPNATKCLGRRMPELKGEVVTGFISSTEQPQSNVFLDTTDHLS